MFNRIGCNVLVDVRVDGTSLIGSEEIQNPLKPVMTVSTGLRIKPEGEAHQFLLCPDPAYAEKWPKSPQTSLLDILVAVDTCQGAGSNGGSRYDQG